DTVVYVRTVCQNPNTELGCVDDEGSKRTGALVLPLLPPGIYYVVLDSFNPGSLGHYKLMVEKRLTEGDECTEPAPGEPDPCLPGLTCRRPTATAPFACMPHLCGDGEDNDGDGKTDYPGDAGCESRLDDTEGIPIGDPVPECGDGEDNDGDGKTDYPDDSGCNAAADDRELDDCVPGLEVVELSDAGYAGDTTDGSEQYAGSCGENSDQAQERIHSWRATRGYSVVRFTLAKSSFASTLYVRAAPCDSGGEIDCVSPTAGAGEKTVEVLRPERQREYFVFVDGAELTAFGSYELEVSGEVLADEPCAPADSRFPCVAGYYCSASTSKCEPTPCNDKNDNDRDLKIDYPKDPGCLSPSDMDEKDPPLLPVCSNGQDDDGDGSTDYPDDPGCKSAAGNLEEDECIAGVPILAIPEGGVAGVTSGSSHFSADSSCAKSTEWAAEAVHGLTIVQPLDRLELTAVGLDFNSVLYVRRDDCGAGSNIGCHDGQPTDVVTLESPSAGTYFVFVDGRGTKGRYELSVRGEIPISGACDPASADFVCSVGARCNAATYACVATQCNDGNDNDGDERIDSFDPGCLSLDDDESGPATMPQCADSIDNDNDDLVDYPEDPGCLRAGDDLELDCHDGDPIVDVTYRQSYRGSTDGATHDFAPSCGKDGSTGPDAAHSFVVPGMLTSLEANTFGSAYDTILYVRYGACAAPDSKCSDDATLTNIQSQVVLSDVGAGVYFFIVDGYDDSRKGEYALSLSGRIAAGERCDKAQIDAGILQCASGRCRSSPDGDRCQ
ncbi:MAG: hypothetical protein V2A73_03930, partial [Pseudomonadota bacterium]